MNLILLGQFETDADGKLVVTDPCYDLKTWCNKHIQVKPGLYDVYLVYGKLKDPLFDWDRRPKNFRNAQLTIIHADHKGDITFGKSLGSVSVDSGQAGFFNVSTYKKDSEEALGLDNYAYHFFKEHVSSGLMEAHHAREVVRKNKDHDLFQHMLPHFKNDEAKTLDFFQREFQSKIFSLKRSRKILQTRQWPSYLDKEKTKDFYKIQCDLSSGEFSAGVSQWGVNSSAGEGDGGYSLKVAKNKKKEIIAATLEFIDLKRLK